MAMELLSRLQNSYGIPHIKALTMYFLCKREEAFTYRHRHAARIYENIAEAFVKSDPGASLFLKNCMANELHMADQAEGQRQQAYSRTVEIVAEALRGPDKAR